MYTKARGERLVAPWVWAYQFFEASALETNVSNPSKKRID
jgi:hypothetical protein